MATFIAWLAFILAVLTMLGAIIGAFVILLRKFNEGMEDSDVPGTSVHSSEEPQGVHVRVVWDDDPEGK
jgi:hypothetical protein